MAKPRQRAGQQVATGAADAIAAAAAEGSQQQQDAVDPVRAAKLKTLLLQTSAVVLAAVVLAYFKLISDKMAMGVIVLMYLTVRFFS
jgi:hypothetical protein